jgi:hypothetical protein
VSGETQQLARPWWYEDPARRHDLRFWTGTEWSEFVIDGPNRTPSLDPPTASGARADDTGGGVATATEPRGGGAEPRPSPEPASEATESASSVTGGATTQGSTGKRASAEGAPAEGTEAAPASRKRRLVLLGLAVAVVAALVLYALVARGSDGAVGASSGGTTASSASAASWDAQAPEVFHQAQAAFLTAEKGRSDAINGSATGNVALSNLGATECDQGESELKQARDSLLPVPRASGLSDTESLGLVTLLDAWIDVAHRCNVAADYTGAAEATQLEAALAQL